MYKGVNMEFITTSEASAKWGISTIRITILANEGRIPGATKLGRQWLIPASATKPQELRSIRGKEAQNKGKKGNDLAFPLYFFRPDWSYIKNDLQTEQEKQLLEAEVAILECRFNDAHEIIEGIMASPESIKMEIGSLWCAGVCCIGLNKPEEFSKVFLRLQVALSKDMANRKDMMIVLDSLKTYTQTLSNVANEYTFDNEINDQCLLLSCLLAGYSQLSKEAIEPGSTDVNELELNLRLVKLNGSAVVGEFLHLYLLGIYYMRNEMEKAQKHAKAAVKIAKENTIYFPLVTYYRYIAVALDPVIDEYAEDFKNHIMSLVADYEQSYNAFYSSVEQYNVITKLMDSDFPYLYAVMTNMTNADIAQRMNVSSRTVRRKLDVIYKTLGVSNKKELKDYLKQNI